MNKKKGKMRKEKKTNIKNNVNRKGKWNKKKTRIIRRNKWK